MSKLESYYSPVIWIAHEYQLSGANYSMLEFMKTLHEEGVEQMLIVNKEGPVEKAAEKIGADVHFIKFYGWTKNLNASFFDGFSVKKKIRNLIATLQLVSIIKKTKAELIVTSTTTFSVGAWSALLTGRKHFWRISEMGELDFNFKLPYGKWAYRFMEKSSDKILLNSTALKEKYNSLIKDHSKLKVVYNPVLIEFKNKWENSIHRFEKKELTKLLLLGQINRGKGHLDALRAIRILNGYAGSKKYYLSIAGNLPNEEYLNELKQYVLKNSLEGYVKFYSFTNDVESLMYDHDILLMCSKAEAFGRVTAEAMKRRLLVIGTATGGTLDMVIDGETGLLYCPGNSQELSEKILEMSALTRKEREQMLDNACKMIEQITDTTNFLETFVKPA